MPSTTVPVTTQTFTAGGVTYKVGDIVPEDHYRVWPVHAFGNRVSNGFITWKMQESAPAPRPTEEDETLGGMASKGGKKFVPTPDTPTGNALDDRTDALKAMSADDLKKVAAEKHVPYTTKANTVAAILAVEFPRPAPALTPAQTAAVAKANADAVAAKSQT